jgi:hypothetical protein
MDKEDQYQQCGDPEHGHSRAHDCQPIQRRGSIALDHTINRFS